MSHELLDGPPELAKLEKTASDLLDQAKMFEGTGWQSGNVTISFANGIAEYTKTYPHSRGESATTALITRDEYDELELVTEILRPYAHEVRGLSLLTKTHYPFDVSQDVVEIAEIGRMQDGKFVVEGLLSTKTEPASVERFRRAQECLDAVVPPLPEAMAA